MGTTACEVDLQIKNLRQPKRSAACGPICFQMILRWHGVKAEIKQIKKAIRFRNGATEAGLALGFKQFNIDSVCYCPPDGVLIPGRYATMDIPALTRVLKIRASKTTDKDLSVSYRDLADAAQQELVSFALPTEKQIARDLYNNTPWIVGLSPTILYPDANLTNPSDGHFVVIQGYDDNNFIINDPCADLGGIHKIQKERVIAAMYKLEGSGLAVYGPK